MTRYHSIALFVAALWLPVGFAQEIVTVNHPSQHSQLVVEGGACATGQCATCNDCVRVTVVKKTEHPVYACKIKEICIPNCGLFSMLTGCQGGCTKIEVKQLVKRYRTDEECVSKCMTAEEAAKHYEAEAKKAADKAKSQMPAPTPAPAPGKLSAGTISFESEPAWPAAANWTQPLFASDSLGARKN